MSSSATASSSSSSLPSSLSAALSHLPSCPSFSVQADWEQVLREFAHATTGVGPQGGRAGASLPKESRQFWASAAKFGEEDRQREAIARLEEPQEGAAGQAEGATASTASASSLSAAARAIRLHTDGANSSTDLQLQFRSPLQLLLHSTSLGLAQLVQAPRATHAHLHPKGDVHTVDVSSSGALAVSGGIDGSASVWDAQTGALRASLPGHRGDVTLARWFPSGVVALTAGLDLSIKLWAVEPQAALAAQLLGHSRPVTAVCFVGRGRNLISAAEDGTAKLWDVSRQSAITTYPMHKEDCPPKINHAILMDPTAHPLSLDAKAGSAANEVSDVSGSLLLTGGSDGIVRGFDLRTAGQVLMIPSGGRAGGIDALLHGPAGRTHCFTLGTSEGAIAVMDLRNKQPTHVLRQDDAAITSLRAWGEDSFWSSNSTGAVNLWRLSGSSGSIVAQLSGVDCEPAHELCLATAGPAGTPHAFVASHGAVRVYGLGHWPAPEDTREFHGLELPARSSPMPTAAATATAATK